MDKNLKKIFDFVNKNVPILQDSINACETVAEKEHLKRIYDKIRDVRDIIEEC